MSDLPLPWFRFWVERWRRSRKVKAMPRHIRSMYLDLLCEIWVDGPISDDEEVARGLLGEDPRSFKSAWVKIRAALTVMPDGSLSSRLLEDERRHAQAQVDAQRKRANARWDAERRRKQAAEPPQVPREMPRHSPQDADLRSQISEEEESENTRVRARGAAEPLKLALKQRTGVLVPDGQSFLAACRLLEEYAEASGVPVAEVADRSLVALAKISGGWSNPQAVTTQRLVSKWDDVQATMAGSVPPKPIAPEPRPMASSRPMREPPTYRDADDVLEEQERRREQLNRERAAGGGS